MQICGLFPFDATAQEGMAAHVYTSFVYRCWKMCQVAPTSPPSLLTLPSPLPAHHPTYFFKNFLKEAIIFCKKYVLFFYRFLFTVDSPFSGRRGGIASCIPYFVCVLFRLTSSSCHWILWYLSPLYFSQTIMSFSKRFSRWWMRQEEKQPWAWKCHLYNGSFTT